MSPTSNPFYLNWELSDDEERTIVKGIPDSNPTLNTRLQEALQSARQKLTHELDCMPNGWIGVSLQEVLLYIATERLALLPHSGSQWDKALKDAESFAVHISQFHRFVEPFLPQSSMAAELIWDCCHVLLELTSSQAQALEKAFGVLYILSLDLMVFHRFSDVLGAIDEANRELGQAYSDILSLLVDITISYQRGVNDDPTATLASSPESIFLPVVVTFRARKERLLDLIWDRKLQGTTIKYQMINHWLISQDYRVRYPNLDTHGLDRVYPGLSCDWFQKHLTGFLSSQDKALIVTGRPGCGKTSLFLWTLDMLKRRVLHKTYTTLAYSIDPAIVIEISSVCLLQSLLSQILEQSVGDVTVISRMSTAYDNVSAAKDLNEIEQVLWKAFAATIQAFATSTNVIIIVDGLDAIAGGELKALETLDRLYDSIASRPNTSVLVFTRPFSQSSRIPSAQLSITTDHTYSDMLRMVENDLAPHAVLEQQQADQRAAVVERIARNAAGSFVWAELVIGLLQKENTLDGMLQILERIPKSVAHVVHRLVSSLDADSTEAKYALSWLTTAFRPLSFYEFQLLLSSLSRKQPASNSVTSITDSLVLSGANLLISNQGIVRIRHNVIRDILQEVSSQGRGLMPPKEAHGDIALRLLTLARSDTATYEVPMMSLSSFDGLQARDSILQYTAESWLLHFYRSSMYNMDNDFVVPLAIKKNFPESSILPALEAKVWILTDLTPDPLNMHRMALQIRRAALGNASLAVLQSMVNLATRLAWKSEYADAGLYFYEAAKLSQQLLGLSSDVTSGCASNYMDCARHTPGVSSLSLPNVTSLSQPGYKEEMLKLLVDTSRHQCGTKSDHVIKYQEALGDFYMGKGDESSAIGVFDELHDIAVERFGPGSAEATNVNAKLAAALQNVSDKGGDTMVYAEKILALSQQTMNVADPRLVGATMHMVEAYQDRGDFDSAEVLLLCLCKDVDAAAEDHPGADIQKLNFEVATAYIKFLQRCDRKAEATSQLLSLWTDFNQPGYRTDLDQLRSWDEMLQTSGELDWSLSEFLTMWNDPSSGPHSTDDVEYTMNLHEQLLQKYREEYGPAHPLTINTLYKLSSLTEPINTAYNQQILDALNGGASVCHPSATKAALELLELYSNQGQWDKALEISGLLWQSACQGLERGLKSDTLESLYDRHRNVLVQAGKGDYSTLRNLAAQNYQTSSNLFRAQAGPTTKAALELAKINEREEAHQVEAVRLYQHIINTPRPMTAEYVEISNSIAVAKTRLGALYRTMSLKPTTYFSEVIGDALVFFRERYEAVKAEFGCSDDRTLDSLADLVHQYAQQDNASSRKPGSDLLQGVAAEIISTETPPFQLMTAAFKLASIYSNEGYSQQFADIVDILRQQFFLEDAIDDETPDVVHRSLDPKSYIFITTLARLDKSEKQAFRPTMMDLLFENRCFKLCVESESLKDKLYWGLRLHGILRASKRSREVEALEKMLLKALFGTIPLSDQPTKQTMRAMLTQVLDQLRVNNDTSVNKAIHSAGNDLVGSLIKMKAFGEAYAIANSTFNIAQDLKAYENPQIVAFGLRLCLALANHGVDAELQDRMGRLSSALLSNVLKVPDQLTEGIKQLDPSEVKEIVGLLNQQKSLLPELESLLSALWSSHATQKSWTREDVVWFGRRFVEVKFARGNKDSAIELCEDIIYNLTTLWGELDPTTIVPLGFNISNRQTTQEDLEPEDVFMLDADQDLGANDASSDYNPSDDETESELEEEPSPRPRTTYPAGFPYKLPE